MKKLTYAIALSSLLLAGCSQDEGIMESKGELVTLNYNVSLGNGVQSRAGEVEDLAVNKLLCVIFESSTGTEVKRDFVDINDEGKFIYSPKLFSNIDYKIAFWAYYADGNNNSCFDLTDVRAIKINSNFDKGNFIENKFKDAYTANHEVKLTEKNQIPTITLSRPFGMVNVLTSKTDYDAAVAMGSTPTTGSINIGSCSKTYNAYTQEWSTNSDEAIQLNTSVAAVPVQYNNQECYCLASEYVFGNGNVTTTNIQVKDANDKVIYNSTISDMPIGVNTRTNLYNPTLLTGGGVTYTIIIDQDFKEEGTKNI